MWKKVYHVNSEGLHKINKTLFLKCKLSLPWSKYTFLSNGVLKFQSFSFYFSNVNMPDFETLVFDIDIGVNK